MKTAKLKVTPDSLAQVPIENPSGDIVLLARNQLDEDAIRPQPQQPKQPKRKLSTNGALKKRRMSRDAERRKLVVIGDGHVGKTSLLFRYTRGIFTEAYIPTMFETYLSDVEVFGRRVELALWDTAGQEDYAKLRPISYPDTNVFLACYSVDEPDSYHNIRDTWVAEVRHSCPGVPLILVATKCDLRDEPRVVKQLSERGEEPVSRSQGVSLASDISASAYLECSSKTGQGIEEVFQVATKAALVRKKTFKLRKGNRCVIL